MPGSLSSALQAMLRVRRLLVDELPLHPRREAGAAASAQARRLHHLDHLVGRDRQRFLQSFVALVLQIEVEREAVRARGRTVVSRGVPLVTAHEVNSRIATSSHVKPSFVSSLSVTSQQHDDNLKALSRRDARRSSINFPAFSGVRHSCHESLTITTGARSHAPETFHFHERERSGCIRLARLDPSFAADLLGHPLGAVQRARQRAADIQHEGARPASCRTSCSTTRRPRRRPP